MAASRLVAHDSLRNKSSQIYHPKRPLDLAQVKCGWHGAIKEYDYWVPKADIEGELPQDLKGTLMRNGPGISEVYGKRLVHPIDGDGMIITLTFVGGGVHLRTRFVASKERLGRATEENLPLPWPKLHYRNPSNTNVFYWGGKIVSCYETGLPHSLDPVTLDTRGVDTFNGALELKVLAAHFRLDMENMRLVCMGMKPGVGHLPPSLAIYEFDEGWKVVKHQLHHIPGLNYSHDFLLLPDYYVFHLTPFANMTWTAVLKVYLGWSSPGQELRYYPKMPSQFVIIPRHEGAKHQRVILVNTEPFHIYHFGTSEQHGASRIEFNAVCLGPKFDMTFEKEIWLSNASVAPGNMFTFMIDLDTQKCTRSEKPADPSSVEFPTVHPYRHGHPNSRYCYLMASDREGHNLPYRDVVKFDKEGKHRQVWYSHGTVGEPVFVPRGGWDSWNAGDEDDGYVITQLYVPETNLTEFVVLDAKRVDKGPVATIKLKHHLPYGFHGTFTPEVFLSPPKAKL
ncbi:hypothetical protein EMCRGX_G033178 [Ephydatia muelleri]